jgi:Sulfotransferase family
MRNLLFQRSLFVKEFIKKGGLIRKPYKIFFPDQIPFCHSEKDVLKGIFLTGIHRSGTSWVGHIISKAEGINYWREPFNPSCRICKRQQYQYLTRESQDEYYKYFTDKLFKGQFVGSIPDYIKRENWYRNKSLNYRIFIKDPTGAFLLDWLNYHYKLDTLILFRHPAAFVSSIIKLNWDFDFRLFLNQKDLMKDWLSQFDEIIKKYDYQGITAEKAAVLWGVVYTVLYGLIKKDNYHIKLYEDICKNPIQEFRNIFSILNLEWHKNIEEEILSSMHGEVTFSKKINHHIRDTKNMQEVWKSRLTKKEIYNIRDIVNIFELKMYDSHW